jgi:hypothetical protein
VLANNSSVTEGNQDGINVYGSNTVVDHCTIGWTDDENIGIGALVAGFTTRWTGPDGNGDYTYDYAVLSEPTGMKVSGSSFTKGTGDLGATEYGYSGTELRLGVAPNNATITHDYLENVVISNNIIAEGLEFSNDSNSTDENSKGLLAGGVHNLDIFKNLFIHNHYRNPSLNPDIHGAVVNNYTYNPSNATTDATKITSNTDSTEHSLVAIEYNLLVDGPSGNILYVKGDSGDSYDVNSSGEYRLIGNKVETTTQTDADDWSVVRELTSYADVDALETAHKSADPYDYGYTAEAVTSVKTNVLAYVGARPDDRTDIEDRLIDDATNETGSIKSEANLDNEGAFPNWPGTGDPGYEVDALATNTRNVGTGMVAAGFVNMPDLSTDTDADGRVDWLELFLDPITEDVEGVTPASPPASSSNITGVTPVGVTIQ